MWLSRPETELEHDGLCLKPAPGLATPAAAAAAPAAVPLELFARHWHDALDLLTQLLGVHQLWVTDFIRTSPDRSRLRVFIGSVYSPEGADSRQRLCKILTDAGVGKVADGPWPALEELPNHEAKLVTMLQSYDVCIHVYAATGLWDVLDFAEEELGAFVKSWFGVSLPRSVLPAGDAGTDQEALAMHLQQVMRGRELAYPVGAYASYDANKGLECVVTREQILDAAPQLRCLDWINNDKRFGNAIKALITVDRSRGRDSQGRMYPLYPFRDPKLCYSPAAKARLMGAHQAFLRNWEHMIIEEPPLQLPWH